MENRGYALASYEPPKPTAAEIADWKERRENAELIMDGMLKGCELLRAAIEEFGEEISIDELAKATTALSNAAMAMNHLASYAMPPFGYSEDMEAV